MVRLGRLKFWVERRIWYYTDINPDLRRKVMRAFIGLVLIALVVGSGSAVAQFYKFTDNQGNIRFTDDINQVPEEQRAKARPYAEAQSPEPPAAARDAETRP
ncbi:MAG: DUF4124 domain-containing protein, partial [Desulfobacteraceae bacterium]